MQDQTRGLDWQSLAGAILGVGMAVLGVLIAALGATPIFASFGSNQEVGIVWLTGGAAVSVGGVCLLVFGMTRVLIAYNGRVGDSA